VKAVADQPCGYLCIKGGLGGGGGGYLTWLGGWAAWRQGRMGASRVCRWWMHSRV